MKFFNGNGTEVFAVHGWNYTSFNKIVMHIPFGESKNITIQVFLSSKTWSYVKIDYGILKQRLNLGKGNICIFYRGINIRVACPLYEIEKRVIIYSPKSSYNTPFVYLRSEPFNHTKQRVYLIVYLFYVFVVVVVVLAVVFTSGITLINF